MKNSITKVFAEMALVLLAMTGLFAGCNGAVNPNPDSNKQDFVQPEAFVCDIPLVGRYSNEAQEQDSVGFYEYSVSDEQLEIKVYTDDRFHGTLNILSKDSGVNNDNVYTRIGYQNQLDDNLVIDTKTYSLETGVFRSDVVFSDRSGNSFEVWTKFTTDSITVGTIKVMQIDIVVRSEDETLSTNGVLAATIIGNYNSLTIFKDGVSATDEIIEQFLDETKLINNFQENTLNDFASSYNNADLYGSLREHVGHCGRASIGKSSILSQNALVEVDCDQDKYDAKKDLSDWNFKVKYMGRIGTALGAVGGAIVFAGGAPIIGGALLAVGAALAVSAVYATYQAKQAEDWSNQIEAICGVGADPYFHTLDGLAYPFQAPGRFVLLERSSDPGFALQIHQKTQYFETCSPGALIKTAALQVGGHRVVFDSSGGDAITIDGIPREFNRQAIELDGGVIHEMGTGEYRVEWDSGERADISVYVDHLDLQIKVVDEYMSEYRGLLGQHATAEEGALQLRDARVLDGPVAWETLHGSFADSWRVRANESLFNDIAVVTPLSPMPRPHRLDEIGTAAQARAVRACTQAGIEDGNLMHHCVLDVGCSGDVTYAQSYTQFPAPKRVLPLDLRRVTQSTSVDLSHTTMANLDAPKLNDLRTVRMPATDSCGGAGSGDSAGDPHLRTLDGLAYDLQAVGEFVLVEAFAGKPLQIQVRQQPEPGSRCANVSYNTAVAARLGGYRVTVDSRRAKPLWIDGAPSDVPAGYLPLGSGDGIFEVSEGHYRLRWADNSLLDIKISNGHLALATLLPDSRLGQVHGLLGRYNGDRSDDLSLRDGTILTEPVKWFDLYDAFAQSWRITPEESLFDYEAGESTASFSDESAPSQPTTLNDLPDDGRAVARQTCEDAGITDAGLLDDCTMDVYCTGEDSYADVHARRAPADAQADVNNDGTREDVPTSCAPLDSSALEGGATLGPDQCYYVSGTIEAKTGVVAIKPNTRIYFAQHARFIVTQMGRLQVEGSEDKPVLLAGSMDEPGLWTGIQVFGTASGENFIHHATIRNAGSKEHDQWEWSTGALYIGDRHNGDFTAQMDIDQVRFKDNLGSAITQANGGSKVSVTNTVFENNETPITVAWGNVGGYSDS